MKQSHKRSHDLARADVADTIFRRAVVIGGVAGGFVGFGLVVSGALAFPGVDGVGLLVNAVFVGLFGVVVGLVVGPVVGFVVVGELLVVGAFVEVVGELRTKRRSGADSWRQSGRARLLSLPLRLAFGPQGEAKLEEWLADLAAIESRWELWVYLLDLLFDLPLQARAAREATRQGPR